MQIDDAREFIKFLHGAVPWNGTWFGEYAPGERGAYWWRKHLDEAIAALIAAPAAPQQAEPVYLVAAGAVHCGHETYTRHDSPPPHCDCEVLYHHPPAAAQRVPAGWRLAPVEPVPEQSDELARDIIMWWSMSPPTGAALYLHLKRLGREIPTWMPTMIRDAVYVPPKGVVAMMVYRAMLDAAPAAPVQAQGEPVAQIGWADEFGNLFPMGAWKPAQRTHHDAHKTAWRPVFLHPPAAEVQRLRDAARDVCEWADAAQWALGNETGVPAAKLDALRKALEGGE